MSSDEKVFLTKNINALDKQYSENIALENSISVVSDNGGSGRDVFRYLGYRDYETIRPM